MNILRRYETTLLTVEPHLSLTSCLIAFQRFNVTVQGSVALEVESNKTKVLSEVFYDLSGCRISGKTGLNGSSQQTILDAIVLNSISLSDRRN